MKPVHTITAATVANAIFQHPLRRQILILAQTPRSAADIARLLNLPRQRTNYHVRQLADAGLLEPAARQRKRNMTEQQYIASAQAYVLSPDLLGSLSPAATSVADPASAGHLVALCARAEAEVAGVMESAAVAGVRLRTFSLQQELQFETAEDRLAFLQELRQAVEDVVAQYEVTGTSAQSRRFRLLVGCYPAPSDRGQGTRPAPLQ